MIQGSFKATMHLKEEQQAITVVPMIGTIWDSLNYILTMRSNEKELIIATCALIKTQIEIVLKREDIQ